MESQKLDPEFKAQWTAALRSGDYKQGREELYNKYKDCYCCLGVAGKILGIDQRTLEMDGFLPHGPLIICGTGEVPTKLMNMNDSDEKSFPEIADWIDANL